MKKIGIIVFCISLCVAIALILPRVSTSWPLVDDFGCLETCHGGENPFPDGQIHSVPAHSDCSSCHDGSPEAGNVASSTCIVFHPTGDPGECNLVNLHETFSDCIKCHPDCDKTETTTTTTTGSTIDVTGDRYEIFFIGGPAGCNATTINFRTDNVLVLDCMDGFGVYLPFLNFFSAVYWSNDFYLGSGALFAVSGVAFDPFIAGAGMAYYDNAIRPLAFTGYLLTTN